MRILSVIPSRTWVNSVNGRTASIYGALPYVAQSEAAQWSIVHKGWTFEMDNNTIGFGRPPMATETEALAFMSEYNSGLDAAALASLPGMIAVNKECVAEATEFAATVCGNTPSARALIRSAKRSLKEAKHRLAQCEQRYAALLAIYGA